MTDYNEDLEMLLDTYAVESIENLEAVESAMLTIERGEGDKKALVDAAFRNAHTIKGGAGFLGLRTVQNVAHHLEELLQSLRCERLQVTDSRVSAMLKAVDVLSELFSDAANSNTYDTTDVERLLTSALKSESDEPEVVNEVGVTDPFSEACILIVDDEPDVREINVDIALQVAPKVFSAEDAIRAYAILGNEEVDLIVCDIKMPKVDGLRLITGIRQFDPTIKVLVYSGYLDDKSIAKVKRLGATYFAKPCSMEILRAHMESMLIERYEESKRRQ